MAWDDAYRDHERRRGIGDNRPPEPTPIETAALLVANCNRWMTERPVIKDDDAGRAQEFVTQLRGCRDKLKAAKEAECKPHDDALALIGIKYRDPMELIELAHTRMIGLLTPVLQRKDDEAKRAAEQRRQEAERLREAAERAADRAVTDPSVEHDLEARRTAEAAAEAEKLAGKAPARARVKGDLAPKAMSLHVYWYAEVFDLPMALPHYAGRDEVIAAIETAVKRCANKDARELKDERLAPPGVRFHKRETAQ